MDVDISICEVLIARQKQSLCIKTKQLLTLEPGNSALALQGKTP